MMRQISLDALYYHVIYSLQYKSKGVLEMKMVRLLIQVPAPIKARLDALRKQGTTASGLMRHLLEAHFKQTPAMGLKGR